MAGNVVLSQTIENGKASIDANHLAAGIYNINIKGNTSVTNKKLVIVK
jgi:Secretion system C-terminal sorting domain